jgi:polyisoprenoid-binding protein YceI
VKSALLTTALALAGASLPAAEPTQWQSTQADVSVLCPLTVGGSFEAKTSALAGSLAVSGPNTLSVDLRSLDTGIALRNDHLRETYLEVEKGDGFDKAVLSEIQIAAPDPGAFQGRTTFTGTLRLHGVAKAVTGPAEIRRSGATVRVTASFPILLADFGIAKPRYLGVGVKDEVRVNVTLVMAPVETR